jgi:iron(III) transport system substrate-binding protein
MRIKTTALFISAVVVLAGCGGSSTDAPAAPTAPPAPAPTAPAAPEKPSLVIDGEVIADGELWEAAQAEGGFTFYSTMVEGPQLALIEIFEGATGLRVPLIHMPAAGGLFERIVSEHASGVLEAALIQITAPALAQELSDRGIYLEHRIEAWDAIGDEYKYDEGKFYAVLQPVNAIAYNTNLVSAEEAPKSWQDLLDPKWKNNIGLVHIGAGGSTWSRDLWLRQAYGIEFWEALAAQQPQILNGAGQTTEEMARGEFAISMNLPHVIGNAARDGAPVANIIPTDGAIGYAHYVGLADGSKGHNAARVFLNWYFSLHGQTQIADIAASYPVRDGAPGPVVGGDRLPPPGEANIVVPALKDVNDKALQDAWQADWYRIFGYTP